MQHFRFHIHLSVLFLFLIILPFIGRTDEPAIGTTIAVHLMIVAVILSAVNAVSVNRRSARVAMILAAPVVAVDLAFLVAGHVIGDVRNPVLEPTSQSLNALFLGYASFLILKYLLATDRVTMDTICAAVCVYIMFGIFWSIIYSMIYSLDGPEAFHLPEHESIGFGSGSGSGSTLVALYYSFVTMTTLGYGDIHPVSPVARMFSSVQALFGQVYLAVLVAKLVGIHIAQSRTEGGLTKDDLS